MIDVVDPELVVVDDDGLDDEERRKELIEQFNNNFLRTSMIEWKRQASHPPSRIQESGWEIVSGSVPEEDNYIKYLLETFPENVTDEPRDGWIRADDVDIYLDKEAETLLGKPLEDKPRKNYWLDSRVLGKKWRGLFNKISAEDEIIIMDPPM